MPRVRDGGFMVATEAQRTQRVDSTRHGRHKPGGAAERAERATAAYGGRIAAPSVALPARLCGLCASVAGDQLAPHIVSYRFSTTNTGTVDPPPAVTFRSAEVESRVRHPDMYRP